MKSLISDNWLWYTKLIKSGELIKIHNWIHLKQADQKQHFRSTIDHKISSGRQKMLTEKVEKLNKYISTIVHHQRAQGHLGQDFSEKGGGRLPGHGCLFITL